MGAPSTNFFQNVIFLHKLWLKLAKLTKNVLFLKVSFLNVIILKLSLAVHALKNIKNSLKIGQLLPILANFSHI
jgi:hypothetical protein